MPIMLKRKNGEITLFRNAEYIPAYYFIPKSILAKCGSELNDIPRNPKELLHDLDAIATVESDLFRLLIIDAYAFMVWPFMELGTKREIYSGYEPSWRYAHAASIWISGMEKTEVIPKAKDILSDDRVDFNFGYVSEMEASDILASLVPQIMAENNMQSIIEVADEYRCFEDFDYRNSRQKIDFYRKWYHTKTNHPMISLEAYKEEYTESHDGQEWDMVDNGNSLEDELTSKIQVDEFMTTLTEKDKQILEMRMQGFTLEEIADKLGYQNHSGVLKRICKIGQAYEKFADVDYGFSEKEIVSKVI